MAIELRQVTSGGYGEILPDWSELTFSQDLLEPGTLTFDYPLDARNAELLTHTSIFAVLVDGTEPANGRFVYDEGRGSRLVDEEGLKATFGCTSVLSLGEKMSYAPAVGSTFADENLFAFTDKTPGFLVRNLFANVASRANVLAGMPTWATYPITAFSDTHDSAGVPWPTTVDVRFNSGDTLIDVLNWLTSNGYAEPLMVGRELRLYIPSNNGTDKSLGSNPIVLATGRDFTEATYQTTSKTLVNSVLVTGEDNSCVWVQDAASAAQYGYREGKFSVQNASQTATLTAAGQAYLNLNKVPRYSYTYSVSALYLDENNPYQQQQRPFVDFRVGDSVLIMDGISSSVQRVRLLSATWPSSQSAAINISVNDFFDERQIEFERRLSRLGI